MSMTIGRFTTTEDPDANTLRQSGDVVSFESMIVASSVAEMKARVQQLRGLMGNDDEQVIAFTWSEDSTFDGYYTDLVVQVADMAAMLESGACPFSLSMRRVANGYAKPRMEILTQSVVRTNPHGIAAPNGIVAAAVSSASSYALDVDFVLTIGASVSNTQRASDGTYLMPWTKAAPLATVAGGYSVAPAYYYGAACAIEVAYSGTYYTMVGQQIPMVTSGGWRLTNGLVRCYPSGTSNLTIEVWDNTAQAWEGVEFQITSSAGAATKSLTGDSSAGYYQPQVLRNSPECCVLRIRSGPEQFTITIHRGSRVVTVSCYGASTDWGAKVTTGAASTGITGGIRQTANDASGNRFVIASAAAFTSVLASGGLYLSASATSASFGLGMELGGSGASAPNTAANMVDQFFAPAQVRQQVVAQ